MANLETRSVCYDGYGDYYNCNSGWVTWGRWVLFGAIVLGAFLLFLVFAIISSRRRRRYGLQPYRGTGWAGRTPFGHGPAQYNPQYVQNQPAPPAYNQGGYYAHGQPNQGYYGGEQPGFELQQPPNAYRGGDNVYEPPSGPPPGKKDNTIR